MKGKLVNYLAISYITHTKRFAKYCQKLDLTFSLKNDKQIEILTNLLGLVS